MRTKVPGQQQLCEARGFGEQQKLFAFIPMEYVEQLEQAVRHVYPTRIQWQWTSCSIDYKRCDHRGFTEPAKIGDKVWFITARPRKGHISEWDSRGPYHYARREYAESEVNFLNEQYPHDNYLLTCLTVGWVCPEFIERAQWQPEWFPIGARPQDQPSFAYDYDSATKSLL